MINDATLGSPVIQTPINFTGSGDQILVPGTTGVRTGVLQFFFIVSASTVFIYKSGSTALTGQLAFVTSGAQVQDFIQLPMMCNPGDPFIINSTNAVTLGGTLWYFQAPGIQ